MTNNRRNYIVFIMNGNVAFAGTQKAFRHWGFYNIPGFRFYGTKGEWGIDLVQIARYGMMFDYFTYKKDMDAFVADYQGQILSKNAAMALVASAIVDAIHD